MFQVGGNRGRRTRKRSRLQQQQQQRGSAALDHHYYSDVAAAPTTLRRRLSVEGSSSSNNNNDTTLSFFGRAASSSYSNNRSSTAPLDGTVICLTGFPSDEKIRMHQCIEQLGGRFTRDLDTTKNTHLIAQYPGGQKYETAVAAIACAGTSQKITTTAIRSIVSPTWLDDCMTTGTCVDEMMHSLTTTTTIPSSSSNTTIHNNTEIPLLERQLEEALRCNNGRDLQRNHDLFPPCRFLLVGFNYHDNGNNNNKQQLLGRLIRREKGTIYWELNEIITHLIVADNCNESYRDAARTISLHHPNGPAVISPLWVVSCWKEKRLVPTESFPPRRTVLEQVRKRKSAKATNTTTKKKKKRDTTRRSSTLFRGSVFVLLRITPPSDGVDFDGTELRTCITSQGGQLLSSELLNALRADHAAAASNNDEGRPLRRTCYVVCWGGAYAPIHRTVHPLLSRIEMERLCDVVPVSPIWLYSCRADDKLIRPNKNFILFHAQPWPLRRLVVVSKVATGDSKREDSIIRVSVSGFVGSERTGIVQALHVLGATVTENLSIANTHLICNERKGLKYEKATEWGLYVVSVEWLYHIMEYGYGGKDCSSGDGGGGCEDRFSLLTLDQDEE